MTQTKVRNEVHTRCEFAKEEFKRFSKLLGDHSAGTGSIIGNNPQRYLKKLNQANRVWHHYCDEFINRDKLPVAQTRKGLKQIFLFKRFYINLSMIRRTAIVALIIIALWITVTLATIFL